MGFDFEWLLGEDNYDDFDLARVYEDAVYDAAEYVSVSQKRNNNAIAFATPKENACYGCWHGRWVAYSGAWGGHIFTEEERKALENDEYIRFSYEDKNKKVKIVVGRLKVTKFRGKNYLVFKPTFYESKYSVCGECCLKGVTVSIPKKWNQHEFTVEEHVDLLAGKTIQYVGKTTRGESAVYSASLKFKCVDNREQAFIKATYVSACI